MSTRACIEFIGKYGDKFHIYRHCDGFPDNILPDIKETVDKCINRWSGSEMGQLVSIFLGENYSQTTRIQHYELCHGPAGDESYLYYVRYIGGKQKYEYGVKNK